LPWKEMAKDKGSYSQSKGNECTWQAVSDDHYFIIKFFILRFAVITIQKVQWGRVRLCTSTTGTSW